jgi:hypothetical protein
MDRAMKSIRRFVAILAYLGSASMLDAQVQLAGRVIEDPSGAPVAGATVEVHDLQGRRLGRLITDSDGEFLLDLRDARPVRMRAHRIGYQRVTTPSVDPSGYSQIRVEIRLATEAILLAPLEIVSRARPAVAPTLAGFERRREGGFGWYITRQEIEQRRPNRVSDLLATAPGLSIQRRIVYSARGRGCPAQIYVDGIHINRSLGPLPTRRGQASTTEMFPIDDLVTPTSVEGIEVYQGMGRMPVEFHSPDASCGVVAIWTRRGG